MMYVAWTLLEGVASRLVVIETVLIVDVVKVCVGLWEMCSHQWYTTIHVTGGVTDSELVISAVSLFTSDNCDDGVSAVHSVEQFIWAEYVECSRELC